MELDFSIFKIEYNKVAPKKGRVLVSEPFLQDTYFNRALVLVTDYTKDGCVGFVLNKPLNIKVNEVIADFAFCGSTVSIGGPVSTNTIHYLHTLGHFIPNSVHILDNIYWGGDFDFLKTGIQSGEIQPEEVRFFLGYSGWQPGQLEKELEQNSWIITEIQSPQIMQPTTDVWKDTLSQLGDKYKIWSNFPENPSQN